MIDCPRVQSNSDFVMQRSTDRILTTHVGSLSRPPELIEMSAAMRRGEPVDQALYAQPCAPPSPRSSGTRWQRASTS